MIYRSECVACMVTCPADTRRKINALITSKRRHDVILDVMIMLSFRHGAIGISAAAVVHLPQREWINPREYGYINHVTPLNTDNIIKIKDNKSVCIIIGIHGTHMQ